jgi:AcrR family transcriptional regulator
MGISSQRERAALTREAVVAAALTKADAEGLDALTFRGLAADLGVTPMALYRYVSSKHELVTAIRERAYTEFELPDPDAGSWQDQLRALAQSFRRVLLAHPALAECERGGHTGHGSMAAWRILDVLLGVLRRAGFSIEEAAQLNEQLERLVMALVVLEAEEPPGDPEEQELREREFRAQVLQLPREGFANVIEATDYLCKPRDQTAAFEVALELLIAGLEALLARR